MKHKSGLRIFVSERTFQLLFYNFYLRACKTYPIPIFLTFYGTNSLELQKQFFWEF